MENMSLTDKFIETINRMTEGKVDYLQMDVDTWSVYSTLVKSSVRIGWKHYDLFIREFYLKQDYLSCKSHLHTISLISKYRKKYNFGIFDGELRNGPHRLIMCLLLSDNKSAIDNRMKKEIGK